MWSTLAAVVLGGMISIVSQLTLDGMRNRAIEKAKQKEAQAAVRVIRFHFYAAEQVLKEALETGRWWARPVDLDLGAAGEDLQFLANLLPESEWRIYTGAWRRLRDVIRRFDAATQRITGQQNSAEQQPSPPSKSDMQALLGAFATIDDARRHLQRYVRDAAPGDVLVRKIKLTQEEGRWALANRASHLVDVETWMIRLGPAYSAQEREPHQI